MAESENSISIENTAAAKTAKTAIGLLAATAQDGFNQETLNSKLQQIIETLTTHLNADHGYITLREKDGKLVNSAASFQRHQDDSLITTSNALIEKVMQNAEAILITDTANDPRFSMDPDFQRFNIKQAICSPVKSDDSVTGVIYLDSRQDCKWTKAELELVNFTALFTGLALTKIRLEQKCNENKRLAASGQAILKMSHSVKNILQMVSGAAEVMDFGLKTNEIHRVKRSWEILRPNLERMRKFTMDMLDYSKERRLEPGPCDFNRVIQGAIETLNSQLRQKKSKLNIRIDQNIPVIELDSERIHEMALNLILNAIDIVDENTGIVNVTTKYHPDSNEVEFTVADNGPGISEDMKAKIFEPFESSKNKLGTGLGMAIAKQILDQHHARIEIDTQPGQGTTFRVFFPARKL